MARRSWFASLAAGLVLVTVGACAPIGSGSAAGAGSDAYGSIGMDCATDPFTAATVTPAPSPQPSPVPSMPCRPTPCSRRPPGASTRCSRCRATAGG